MRYVPKTGKRSRREAFEAPGVVEMDGRQGQSRSLWSPEAMGVPLDLTLPQTPLQSSGRLIQERSQIRGIMSCPSCGAENPEGSSFCEACGARIQPACPACGSEYRPGARFCRACGAALTVQEAPSPTAAAPSAPAVPASFAGGRYRVNRFLGEGGKKKVYLAHDTLLDREVALALIKTEGLDEAGRSRSNGKRRPWAGWAPIPTSSPFLTWAKSLRQTQSRTSPTWSPS